GARRIEARQEHAELLAAEPGHQVEFVNIRLDQIGDQLESLIADVVAEPVVHCLELIHVKDQQGAFAAARILVETIQIGFYKRRKGPAIEAVRQWIGGGYGEKFAMGDRQFPELAQQ